MVVAVAACGDPVPSGPPGPTPSGAAPSGAATPSSAAVPTLTMSIAGDLAGGLSDAATGADAVRISALLHDGLYRLDARLRPIPALAEGPATVSDDGLTWTVAIRPGVVFHDGSPLTVDDVIGTYELAASARCPFPASDCLSTVLDGVTAVDDRTVAFVLRTPVTGFPAVHLRIGIESKAAIDAAYAAFLAGARALAVTDTAPYLEAVATEQASPTGPAGPDGSPTVDLARLRADGEALLARASISPPSVPDHTVGGRFDEAAYVDEVVARVRAVDATFTSRPIDALAAAYPFLPTAAEPIATGPYRLVARMADGGLELEANPAHPGGAPAIGRIVVRPAAAAADVVRGLTDGSIDWRPELERAVYDDVRGTTGLRIAEYPEFGYYGLWFNLHPEADGPFRDRALRQALAACIDRPATAAAATGGEGIAIDSEIPRMSWAYPTTGLATWPLDRDLATGLIEASGWALGSDGIYERDGDRLSFAVAVREGFPSRRGWLDRVSDQVRACGIEIDVREVPFASILRMLAVYPHVNAAAPDDGQPFDLYFGGLDTGVDPDPFRLYHSSTCSSAERPDTYNFGCYQDPEVDRLLEEARATTDLAIRAARYAAYASRISEDLPVIYAWSGVVREAIGPRVGTSAAGGLALDTPTWAADPASLTIATSIGP